jgi:hypothetical protein
VGRNRFDDACRWAWKTAATTGHQLAAGKSDEWPKDLAMVPHELSDLVWNDRKRSLVQRVELHFAVYRKMPCYGILMYAGVQHLEDEALDAFWRATRTLLDEPDDRLAHPVAYWLWCGPFEGSPAEAADAFDRVIRDGTVGDRRLERVLNAAGPVPWDVKAPLLHDLVADRRWHRAIFRCIQWSLYDTYGKVNVEEGSRLMRLLDLPPDVSEAVRGVNEELRSRSAKGSEAGLGKRA